MLQGKNRIARALAKQGVPLKLSNILVVTLLMFLLLGIAISTHTVNLVDSLQAEKAIALQAARDTEWRYIETVIKENYSKAEMQSDQIKQDIDRNIMLSYTDNSLLKYDLDNPRPDSVLYGIFKDAIKGKYLNGIQTDNNDVFIATHNGIVADLSLNCSVSPGTSREWEAELTRHYNSYLGSKAIHAIIDQSSIPIFWEYTKSDNPAHNKVVAMTLDDLRAIYFKEGLEGLKSYEFLKPSYIRQQEDILGTADITALGVRQNNYKIIVVSGFNLYDIMNKDHKGNLAILRGDATQVELYFNRSIADENAFCVLVSLVLLICMFVTAVVNNHVCNLIEVIRSETKL